MDEQCYYRVSVKGIMINDDGKILLSREDNGKWDMLGGGLDHDEDPIEGLRREILEEAGLHIMAVSPQPKYFLTSQCEGADTFVANVVYEVTLENLDFTPSDECQELRFFSATEMQHIDLFPNGQKLLEILQSNE